MNELLRAATFGALLAAFRLADYALWIAAMFAQQPKSGASLSTRHRATRAA